MAKKFGKFLLFTAAVTTGAAAAYYYLKQKDAQNATLLSEDDDYDDFSECYDEDLDSSRSYVTLNPETPAEGEEAFHFVPLQDTVESRTEDAVEEFFDEEDPEDMENTQS